VSDLARVLARLENGHDKILAELVEFAAIPSVSTDPAHAADVHAAAAWVAAKLSAAGPFTVRTMPTAGASVVYAEWLGAAGAPTALIYGHYDVQPEDPVEKWHSPPFTPTLVDGRLYARGVSDDKGPLLIAIKVADCNPVRVRNSWDHNFCCKRTAVYNPLLACIEKNRHCICICI